MYVIQMSLNLWKERKGVVQTPVSHALVCLSSTDKVITKSLKSKIILDQGSSI